MDYYEIKTEATETPVSIAEAKLWLKIDSDIIEDDAIVSGLISAAVVQGQEYTGRTFIDTTYTGYFSKFEISNLEQYAFITLHRAPVISITSVKFMVNGSLVDADTDNYDLKEKSTYSRILFKSSPSSDDVPYPLQVEFNSGYANASAVPEDIKTAIKEHALFMYENRGDAPPDGKEGMPKQVKSIYSKYRILETFG